MSHSVTITRTVTSNNTSAVFINSGYMKTVPGLLKLIQLILGGISVGLVAWYQDGRQIFVPDIFFLLMATTFLICTFCLLVSCLISLSTGGIISKTIYELIYHTIGFLLLIIASVLLLVKLNRSNYSTTTKEVYNAYTAAAVATLINSILYLVSAVLARRDYKGI